MQAKFVTAVLLGFVLIGASACGGGGNDAAQIQEAVDKRIAEIQEEMAEEEAAQEEATAAPAEEPEPAKEPEETDAEKKAKQDAAAAEEARKEEERKRKAAEAETARLKKEAEEARQAASAAEAATVLDGLGTVTHTLAATPSYRAAANLRMPNIESTGAGSSGKWFRTNGSSKGATSTQRVVLYSDVEAPKSTPFKDSTYNSDDSVVDAQGKVLPPGFDLGDELRMDVASGSFDRTSSPPKSFDMKDRGEHTTAEARTDAIASAQTTFDAISNPSDADRATLARVKASKVRDTNRHPYRWSAEAGGTLGSASGRFRCGDGDSTGDTSCTVQNTGAGFVFSGPWRFVPASGTVGVRVADSEYMWFGWWSTETDNGFVFDTNHGGTVDNENRLLTFTGVTGTATYNGIAVGQYAISGTLVADQGHGEFTAKALLTADFGASTVIGSITNFSDHPDWEVSLTGGTIAAAAVTESTVTGSTSSWTIGDNTKDLTTGTPWEANFYSNLPEDDRASVQPYGIAGTFEATHGSSAKMAGAFGAHR
ncbi:MAG: hypothetical protein OXC14_08610 [Rhodospirillaceae bacterium]|nr:hypothetical protein [Rhodospirillaceae bacterium]